MIQGQPASETQSKKKKKHSSGNELYFFHEDNRDLWEGHSKQFARPGEVMYRIYGVNPYSPGGGCYVFFLMFTGFLTVLSVSGSCQTIVALLNGTQSADGDTGVLMLGLLLMSVVSGGFSWLFIRQLILEYKYHPCRGELARALADVIRHGEYVTGYVEKIRNYHDIHFYYYDDAGNRQDATYTYDKKDLVGELKFGSRLALIQHNNRFVAL